MARDNKLKFTLHAMLQVDFKAPIDLKYMYSNVDIAVL